MINLRRYSLLLLLLGSWTFAKATDTLQIGSFYHYYFDVSAGLEHYIDASRWLGFEEVRQRPFEKRTDLPNSITSTFWARFCLPQGAAKYQLWHVEADSIAFYLPNYDGSYRVEQYGVFTDKSRNLGLPHILVSSEDVDFSRAIYIKVRNFSKWGSGLRYDYLHVYKMPLDAPVGYEEKLSLAVPFLEEAQIKTWIYVSFLSIMGFICVYFLIQFFINKRLAFLWYSLYVLTLFLYFFNRLLSDFFWKLLGDPIYFVIVNENTQTLSYITYSLFIIAFIQVRVRFPRFYLFIKYGLWVLTTLMLFYNFLLFWDRYVPLHLQIMPIIRGVNFLISFSFLVTLLRNKPDREGWIIIAASVVLSCAAFLPPLLGNLFYAMPFLMVEILILALALAYQIRRSDLERLRTKERLIEQLKINAEIQQEMQQKLEAEVRQQTENAVQKTKEAEQAKSDKMQSDFQQELEKIRMKALQAQMNPHFLFNSLNSIRLFYLKNETIKADAYITKFSRLLRLILNHSRTDFISLQEELDALQLYIEFEQMRFNDKFDYTISVEKNVDTTAILIQPLTVQPFVENAIWHGFMQNDRKGDLKIEVQQHENTVKICITDNGIGREQAKILQKNSSKPKSFGLTITQERMELMQKTLQKRAFFEIFDLTDAQGNAQGTRVEINIG